MFIIIKKQANVLTPELGRVAHAMLERIGEVVEREPDLIEARERGTRVIGGEEATARERPQAVRPHLVLSVQEVSIEPSRHLVYLLTNDIFFN